MREGKQGLEMSGRNVTAGAWEVASGVEATLATPSSKSWSFRLSFFTLTPLGLLCAGLCTWHSATRVARLQFINLWGNGGTVYMPLGGHLGGESFPAQWEQAAPRLWSSHTVDHTVITVRREPHPPCRLPFWV